MGRREYLDKENNDFLRAIWLFITRCEHPSSFCPSLRGIPRLIAGHFFLSV